MNALQRALALRPFWGKRAEFYRDVATAMEERELLRDFLAGEHQIASTPATADSTKAAALGFMRETMESGETALHDVLRMSMPTSDSMGIGVIADAKDKASALRNMADNVDQQTAMNTVVKKTLASPLILLPVAFAFAYVMASYVIPAFEAGAPAEVWVGLAGMVRSSAYGFNRFAPWFAGFVVVVLTWFAAYGLENVTAPWRYRAENAHGKAKLAWFLLGPIQPMLSMYRDIQSSRMLANLATLLQAGRGLQDSLNELALHSSPWMARHLMHVVESLQHNPGEYVLAFGQGILSSSVLARLHTKVRRDSGNDFAQVLIEIGTTGQELARKSVSSYAAKVNAFLLVGVFSIILWFYGGQNYIVMKIQEEMSPANIQKRALMKKMQTSGPAKVSSIRSSSYLFS